MLKAVPWTFGELISAQFTVYLSSSVLKAVPWTYGELISAPFTVYCHAMRLKQFHGHLVN